MTYRPDIDGLRAVAVLMVVLHHAAPGFLPGGFIGVDVFFVISGYLITRILLHDLEEGTLHLPRFYARRIRRLFPALAACLAATLAVGWLILLPEELRSLSATTAMAALSISNIYLSGQSSYFAPEIGQNPLFHTWSLALEEQFYLLFPLLVLACWRASPRVLPFVFTALLGASFLWVWSRSAQGSPGAYFLLQGRAWELLAGALLAWAQSRGSTHRRAPIVAPPMVGILGLALVFGSAFAIDKTTTHPGPATIAPVLGSLMILAAPFGSSSRILELAPLVHVGRTSYSVYLWHQPLIVFVPMLLADRLGGAGPAVLVAASLLMGHLSWRLIEEPFRRGRPAILPTLSAFASVTTILIAAGLAVHSNRGFPERVPPEVLALSHYENPIKDATLECHIRRPVGRDDLTLCEHGPDDASRRIAVWGDSHAKSLTSGLIATATNTRIVQASVDGCLPSLSILQAGWHIACNETHAAILDEVISSDLDAVVLDSRWSYHLLDGHNRSPSGRALTAGEFEASLRRIVIELLDAGEFVVIVGPTPEHPSSVPQETARRMWLQGDDRAPVSIATEAYDERHSQVMAMLDRLPHHPRLRRVGVRGVFCPGEMCLAELDGEPLYYDDDHLSVEGASLVAPLVLDAIDDPWRVR